MMNGAVPTVQLRSLALVYELLSLRKVGVEVGVYQGAMSHTVLKLDETVELYLVDPWRAQPSDAYAKSNDKHARMTQDEQDGHYRTTLANVEQFGERAHILRMPSLEAAALFKDGTLDFVFIDADHSYEGCRSDILAWYPKLRNGGLMSGHDYRDDKTYGVIQAVQEFSERERKKVRLGKDHTWFITK